MKLEDIGFYTLSDYRAMISARYESPALNRCELVLTNRCNFNCPYCRKTGTETAFEQAVCALTFWAYYNLYAVRFSGGEPTLYENLPALVKMSVSGGIKHIAVSTNGSADRKVYENLIECGVNDFSVSLDACCAADGDKMAGVMGYWDKVVENIRFLAQKVYTTVGVVLTDKNVASIHEIICFASNLGVKDIRIIPAAQDSDKLSGINVDETVLKKYPILKYRIDNIRKGRTVRGLTENDSPCCHLVRDDQAVSGEYHYPCIIYLREGGNPIGRVGGKMRKEREEWCYSHNVYQDEICRRNCLDVCRDYNNKVEMYKRG